MGLKLQGRRLGSRVEGLGRQEGSMLKVSFLNQRRLGCRVWGLSSSVSISQSMPKILTSNKLSATSRCSR